MFASGPVYGTSLGRSPLESGLLLLQVPAEDHNGITGAVYAVSLHRRNRGLQTAGMITGYQRPSYCGIREASDLLLYSNLQLVDEVNFVI